MPRIPTLITIQGLLTLLQVYFVSKISLIGKIGIALFYSEYRIFRSGWKTFLLFFAMQLMVIFLLWFIEKKDRHGERPLLPVSSALSQSSVCFLLMLTSNTPTRTGC